MVAQWQLCRPVVRVCAVSRREEESASRRRTAWLCSRPTKERHIYFNLYEGDRFGALLFGAPGAGKSVLANLFIDHSQKDEPYTFILDLGGSYRQITRKHGGSYVQMRFGDDRQSFRINPFVLPATADNLQFLFTFVRLLLTNAGYEPSVDDDRELYEAVESMYVFSPGQRTLRNLAHGLPPHLGTVLRPWIADGQYGSVFDNVEDTLTFARFQTFDFQGMDELYPQVLEPLLFYIFQRISQIVYDPALVTSPKQLWADEVWRFPVERNRPAISGRRR